MKIKNNNVQKIKNHIESLRSKLILSLKEKLSLL